MKSVNVEIGGKVLRAEVAESFDAKRIGLSLHSSLSEDEAMWFPYLVPRTATFHMSTVSFPIDIIFCQDGSDGTQRVGSIAANVSPGDPRHYTCVNVSGVLETVGGFCRKNGIRVGSAVSVSEAKESTIRVDSKIGDIPACPSRSLNRLFRTKFSQWNPTRRKKEKAEVGPTKKYPSLNDVDMQHGRPVSDMYDLNLESQTADPPMQPLDPQSVPNAVPSMEPPQVRVDMPESWDFDVEAMQGKLSIVGEIYESIAGLLHKIATDQYDFRDHRLEHIKAQTDLLSKAAKDLGEMAEQSMRIRMSHEDNGGEKTEKEPPVQNMV